MKRRLRYEVYGTKGLHEVFEGSGGKAQALKFAREHRNRKTQVMAVTFYRYSDGSDALDESWEIWNYDRK